MATLTACDCDWIAEHSEAYLDRKLQSGQQALFEAHLKSCAGCAQAIHYSRAVSGVIAYIHADVPAEESGPQQSAREPELKATGAEPSGWTEWLAGAPWWLVSGLLHVLVIALAGLVSMAIELPRSDDAVIMVTELQPAAALKSDPPEKTEAVNALISKLDTPPTDPASKETSDIVVPPDILAQAQLGDHFETINPEAPDTHSALGDPDSRSFHSEHGNTEPAGGGGMGGAGFEDLVGVGGEASRGSGGGFGGGNGTGTGVGDGSGHGSFGQRSGGGRKLMVKRHGGSARTENAVDKALQWLAYHQEADGHWDSLKYGAAKDGKVDTAMTSLAVLAFLGAGHSERSGQYKDNVTRAVAWLKSQQEPNGLIFGKGDENKKLGYPAAMATLALAEAAGMGNNKETRAAAQKAVNYCIDVHQGGDGSDKYAWRYGAKSPVPDISVSGWFIMALKSAKVAGLHVDTLAFEGANKYILDQQIPLPPGKDKDANSGYDPPMHYGYWRHNTICTWRESAIGVLCRQFMGAEKDKVQSSVELFVKEGGTPNAAKADLYYWYYGTLCTFQQGGEVWKEWNKDMQSALLPTQCANGDNTGSWDPNGEFSTSWGRVGQTALGALCLEVYYRYLQLAPDK